LRFRVSSFVLLALLVCLGPPARGQDVITEPFKGVKHLHRQLTDPRPLNIHLVQIELSTPGLRFMLTPPKENPPVRNGVPDETITQTTRAFMEEVGAQIGVNTSFFRLEHHSKELWTNNSSLAVSEGKKYSPWDKDGDIAFNITKDHRAGIVRPAPNRPTGYESLPEGVELWNAVAGSTLLVENGKNVAPKDRERDFHKLHPRTAIGVTGDGMLIIAAVDGRQPKFSQGMHLDELADLMILAGCVEAINLDGGGSTTLAFDFYGDRKPNGGEMGPRLINSPVGRGPVGSERNNGANLAIFAPANPRFKPAPVREEELATPAAPVKQK
jgi:hypothetical protein